MPQAGRPFVQGIVDLQPEVVQNAALLPMKAGPPDVGPVAFFRLPVTAGQGAAVRAEGFLDQR